MLSPFIDLRDRGGDLAERDDVSWIAATRRVATLSTTRHRANGKRQRAQVDFLPPPFTPSRSLSLRAVKSDCDAAKALF